MSDTNTNKNIEALQVVTKAIYENRDKIKELFCNKNPACKAECGCQAVKNGVYDYTKCPIFSRSNVADAEEEVANEYYELVLLGKISE